MPNTYLPLTKHDLHILLTGSICRLVQIVPALERCKFGIELDQSLLIIHSPLHLLDRVIESADAVLKQVNIVVGLSAFELHCQGRKVYSKEITVSDKDKSMVATSERPITETSPMMTGNDEIGLTQFAEQFCRTDRNSLLSWMEQNNVRVPMGIREGENTLASRDARRLLGSYLKSQLDNYFTKPTQPEVAINISASEPTEQGSEGEGTDIPDTEGDVPKRMPWNKEFLINRNTRHFYILKQALNHVKPSERNKWLRAIATSHPVARTFLGNLRSELNKTYDQKRAEKAYNDVIEYARNELNGTPQQQ